MTNTHKVRLALVGLKGINDWHFLPGVRSVPEAELVGGIDPSPEARDSFSSKTGLPAYGSLPEFLSHHQADGVFIGTPNQFHLPNIREAAENNLHVAVTKPLANNAHECREAIDVCRRAGRFLQTNHEYRFRPAIAQAIAMARQGDIGDVTMVAAHMGSNGGIATSNAGTWRSNPENVPGGCVNLLGVHMLDCANAILGAPVSVSARLKCAKSSFGIIDTAAILVDYTTGSLGSITSSYASSHSDSLTIYGTEGNLVLTENTLQRMEKRVLQPVEIPSAPSSAAVLVRQFCHSILEDTPPEISGETGLLLVAMNEAATRSSAEGRTVQLAEILEGGAQ